MSAIEVRVVGPEEESALVGFLESRPDTTMFLRSNLRGAGLEDDGSFGQGTYVAAWRDGVVVAAAAHYWHGDVIFECPVALAAVVRHAVASSGREVLGLIGPRSQVDEARVVLGLQTTPARTDSREDLLALDLARLRVPAALTAGRARCRPASPAEVEAPLTDWRLDYEVENLGGHASGARRKRGREFLVRQREARGLWVLEHDEGLVSMGAFNATLPDCVQIGGVYTPPGYRSRGFARCVVAGSLLDARARGVVRSILFTEEDNAPAQACYRALGYERVGDYGLVLYDKDA